MWVPYQTGEVFTPKMHTTQAHQGTFTPVAPHFKSEYSTNTKSTSNTEGKVHNHSLENHINNKIPKQNTLSVGLKEKNSNTETKSKWGTALQFTESKLAEPIHHSPLHSNKSQKNQMTSQAKQPFAEHKKQSAHAKTSLKEKKRKSTLIANQKANLKIFFFAITYLLGTLCAGKVYLAFSEYELHYLTYYIEELISLIQSNDFVTLLLSQLSVSIITLSIIFLSGFSALGLPLILSLFFCKGLGIGMLLLHFFVKYQWHGVLYYLMIFGTTEAILITCMCALSVTASHNTVAILQYSLYDTPFQTRPRLKFLLGQYIALLVLMCIICIILAISLPLLSNFLTL